jgi:glutamine synthetase
MVEKMHSAERMDKDNGASTSRSASEALKDLKKTGVEWVDLQFPNLFGTRHSISIPFDRFTQESFSRGLPKLDGSSVVGFTEIFESDMILRPDPSSIRTIPWAAHSTARMLADVYSADGKRFDRDSRWITEKADAFQREHGRTSFFGPELEFFAFDSVDLDTSMPSRGVGYTIHAREAPWENTGGYMLRQKGGYYPAEPQDQLSDLRKEIATIAMKSFGIEIEATHHEVATGGQGEINFRYGDIRETPTKVDDVKYIARNVAKKHGMVVTFMPKPMAGDNGTGMHTHFSLWNLHGKNLMFDKDSDYAELSQEGRYAVGGLLRHGRALTALTNPTVNSYRRLVPGFEAPVYLTWSASNRSSGIRITMNERGIPNAKRLEYRIPDPSCNTHLVFPAILMAALDGVQRKIEPGPPVINENIYHMPVQRRKELGIGELPRSLNESLDALESDNEFLKPVMGQELLEVYIRLKREEASEMQKYPHPMELHQYLDV